MGRYEEYKDTGIEWIGSIPSHWDRVRVGSLFYMKGRIGWQGLKAEEFIDDGPYLVTGTDFCDGRVNWSTCYHISQERFDEAPEIHVKNGDLLITKDGTIGKLALITDAPEHVSLNSHLLLLRPLGDGVINRFLYWVLSSGEFTHYTDLSQSGTIMASLSQEKISRFTYATPPTEEQQVIADYLDAKTAEIDMLVADCEREVELLREYRKAIISEAVTKGLDLSVPMKDSGVEWIGETPSTWTIRPSKTVFRESKELRHPEDEQCASTQKYGIIPQTEYIELENQRMVMADKNLDSWKHVAPGDFVISLRSFQGGLELSNVSGCVTWHYIVLRGIDETDVQYYKYLFKMQRFIEALQRTCTYIRDGQDLRYSNFIQVPLPLPPIEEQRAIAAYLDDMTTQIDSLIKAKRAMADKLREYRRSLISEAVTGKFKVPGV